MSPRRGVKSTADIACGFSLCSERAVGYARKTLSGTRASDIFAKGGEISMKGLRAALLLLFGFSVPAVLAMQGDRSEKLSPPIAGDTGRQSDVQMNVLRLKQLKDEALMVSSVQERVRLLAIIADVSWDYDSDFARTALTAAYAELARSQKTDKLAPLEFSEEDTNSLFQYVLQVASSHDVSLTRRMLDQWEERNRDAGGSIRSTDKRARSNQFLTAAMASMESDPAAAREFFRQSVSQSVVQWHLSSLSQIRSRKPELAHALFLDVLDVLRRRPLREANEALLLASFLFAPDNRVGYFLLASYNTANVFADLSRSPDDKELAVAYLTFMLDVFGRTETIAPEIRYAALQNLRPQFSTLVPALLQDLDSTLRNLQGGISASQFESLISEASSHSADTPAQSAAASWDARMEAARKIQDAGRRDLEYFTYLDGYQLPHKDYEGAYQTANRITNPRLQRQLLDYVHLWQSEARVDEKDASLSDYSDLLKISDPMMKTIVLVEVAEFFSATGKSELSQELLGIAAHSVSEVTNSQFRVQLRFGIARESVRNDLSTGYQAARVAIADLNKVGEFQRWERSLYLPVTVWGMRNELPLGRTAFSFASFVNMMSDRDYEGSLQLWRDIRNEATRLWATLLSVRQKLNSLRTSAGR